VRWTEEARLESLITLLENEVRNLARDRAALSLVATVIKELKKLVKESSQQRPPAYTWK